MEQQLDEKSKKLLTYADEHVFSINMEVILHYRVKEY